ncbi:MAG: hypothetical protein WDN08_13750 [Rhizomicrobium sp.]
MRRDWFAALDDVMTALLHWEAHPDLEAARTLFEACEARASSLGERCIRHAETAAASPIAGHQCLRPAGLAQLATRQKPVITGLRSSTGVPSIASSPRTRRLSPSPPSRRQTVPPIGRIVIASPMPGPLRSFVPRLCAAGSRAPPPTSESPCTACMPRMGNIILRDQNPREGVNGLFTRVTAIFTCSRLVPPIQQLDESILRVDT